MNGNSKINDEDFEPIQIQRVIKPKKKRTKFANIEDFTVTTDSVVAKATFVTDTPLLIVKVDWDDGNRDKIDHRADSHLHQPSEGDQLPPGTYEFYHRYDVSHWQDEISNNVAPKEYIITLTVKDNEGGLAIIPKNIRIVPRYRIQFYPLFIGLKNGCDTKGDDRNDFTITQTINGELKNEWDWNPSNGFFVTYPNQPLEGRQFTHELEVSDYAYSQPHVSVRFIFEEHDTLFNEIFRLSFTHLLYTKDELDGEVISARKEGTGSASNSVPLAGSCDIMYQVDYNVKLIASLPNNPNVIFASK